MILVFEITEIFIGVLTRMLVGNDRCSLIPCRVIPGVQCSGVSDDYRIFDNFYLHTIIKHTSILGASFLKPSRISDNASEIFFI